MACDLDDAVVFATPVSSEVRDAVTVEFTRIGSTGARFYLDEPDSPQRQTRDPRRSR